MPNEVHTVGWTRGELAEMFHTQFLFADRSRMVTASSGTIRQQGRPFTHGFEIYLERATLIFDSGGLSRDGSPATPLTVLTNEGRVLRPKLASTDPVDCFAAELSEVVRSLRTGAPSPILDGQLGRDALLLCQRQTLSLVKQRALRV
jgi:hypothetical protein